MSTRKGSTGDGGKYTGTGWEIKIPRMRTRHAAAIGASKWIGKRGATRIPATVTVVGYPATVLAAWPPPYMIIGIGVLCSLVLWAIAYRSVVRANEKASARKVSVAADWATRIALLSPLYVLWLFLVKHEVAASVEGVGGFERIAVAIGALFGTLFSGPWFLGYATGGVLAWLAIFYAPHVVTVEAVRKAAEGMPFSGVEGFDGVKVLKIVKTKTGERYRISIGATGKTQSEFCTSAAAERVAVKAGLPASRVLLTPVRTNAGIVELTIRRSDPWARALVHPRAPEFEQTKTRITDPIVVGCDPEDDREISVRLATRQGGQHMQIVSPTRGGKTTLVNSIVEQLTRAPAKDRDVDVILIDPTKGKDWRAWAPAVAEVYTGPGEIEAALDCLDRHMALIAERSKVGKSAVWKVGRDPAQRAKVIIIDEADRLLGTAVERDVAERAKAAVSFITGKGASEMIILIVITQRGIAAQTGTMDLASNAFTKIVLRMSRTADMNHVLNDWRERGLPDMSSYAEGKHGVILVDDLGAGTWVAGRAWNLSDLDLIAKIGRQRAIREIPAGSGARWATDEAPEPRRSPVDESLLREPPEDGVDDPDPGTEYLTDPDQVPGAPWASKPEPAGPALPRELTAREKAMLGLTVPDEPDTPPAPARAVDPTARVRALRADMRANVAEARTALAEELGRAPEESAARFAMRQAATAAKDKARTVPESFVMAVLDLITAEGGTTTRRRVTDVTDLPSGEVSSFLRILKNQGIIAQVGAGRGARYALNMPEGMDETGHVK